MSRPTTAAANLLSVEQVAQRLVISSKSVRRLVDTGALKVHRIGRLLRVAEEDLRLFLSTRRQ